MKIPLIKIVLFFFISSFGFAQHNILCGLNKLVYINDLDNVPTIIDNENGTITLIHKEQYITDIFAKHTIYDFIKKSSSFYTIKCLSRDLINELSINVPSEIFSIEDHYDELPITSELINFLDGKTFNLMSYCTTDPSMGEDCTGDQNVVPQDFSLQIEFNYDSSNNLLLADSKGLTPCGNSFSLGFKGGSLDNSLQLWQSIPKNSSESSFDMPCYNIEQMLYSIFDISCFNQNVLDIKIKIDSNTNTFSLERENGVFVRDFMSFKEHILSTSNHSFENIKLITSKTNPYIEFTNINRTGFSVEVFSVLGEKILSKIPYQKNTISLSAQHNSLYFIKLSNQNNDYKIFKYLN